MTEQEEKLKSDNNKLRAENARLKSENKNLQERVDKLSCQLKSVQSFIGGAHE